MRHHSPGIIHQASYKQHHATKDNQQLRRGPVIKSNQNKAQNLEYEFFLVEIHAADDTVSNKNFQYVLGGGS